MRGSKGLSTEERFFLKVKQAGEDPVSSCWVWTGQVNTAGYGRIREPGPSGYTTDGPTIMAHRWAWALFRGEIPGDLTVDHLCRNTRCVNPEHMELVPQSENTRRAAGWRNGKCKRGHELTTANIGTTKKGVRHCKPCRRQWFQERRPA